jgi:hypothetical protein
MGSDTILHTKQIPLLRLGSLPRRAAQFDLLPVQSAENAETATIKLSSLHGRPVLHFEIVTTTVFSRILSLAPHLLLVIFRLLVKCL